MIILIKDTNKEKFDVSKKVEYRNDNCVAIDTDL